MIVFGVCMCDVCVCVDVCVYFDLCILLCVVCVYVLCV